MKALIGSAILVTGMVASASAFALKCVGTDGDCDFSVYITKKQVQAYATSCSRSDDNGGGAYNLGKVEKTAEGTKYNFHIEDYVVVSRDQRSGFLSWQGTEVELACCSLAERVGR